MWNTLWQLIIGPAGAVMFVFAMVFLGIAAVLRERTVPGAGTTERLATSRPLINSVAVASVVLGLTATAVRMGEMA